MDIEKSGDSENYEFGLEQSIRVHFVSNLSIVSF